MVHLTREYEEEGYIMEPRQAIHRYFGQNFWLTLAAFSIIAFGVGYINKRFADANLAQVSLQKVLAAGPLPSFELSRSEHLQSDKHNNKLTIVTILARRSDGAEVMVSENRIAEDRPLVERTLFFPLTGIRVLVNDTVRARSTFRYQQSDPAFSRLQLMREDPATKCMISIRGGAAHPGPAVEEEVAGVRAIKLVADGANRHTRWLVPQLGCIEIMTRNDWKDGQSGRVASTAISSPDYLRLSEPSARLFEIPSDYVEVKPSARIDLVNAWMRRAFPEVPPGTARDDSSYRRSADEAYLLHRP